MGRACCSKRQRIPDDKTTSDEVETSVGASFQSDYRYRGISLSRLGPSGSSSIELARDGFYVGGLLYTVRLPGDPVAELTGSAGIRRTFFGIDLDLWAEGYYYPPRERQARRRRHQLLAGEPAKGSRKFDGF